METFLIRALQLIMSLSLLVIIHEGGHFLFSRLFKVRVEKFYIFFDPWFSLFKFKPKNSDTEYGVGWVPLGGYVKISGMIDESMDTEQMKQPAQPWEFRSKPAWQRLLIMIGGVLMNFLLAIFIYSMILFHWGDSYISLQDMTYGMKFNERAQEIGFGMGIFYFVLMNSLWNVLAWICCVMWLKHVRLLCFVTERKQKSICLKSVFWISLKKNRCFLISCGRMWWIL